MDLNNPIMNPILLVFFFIIMSSSSCSSTTFPIAKPGCEDQDHCGSVSIPFPFGTREGCYLDQKFLIQCNDSVAYLRDLSYVVRNISLEGQLRVLGEIGHDCYSRKDNSRSHYRGQVKNAAGTMVFNSTANRLVAIGCDTFAIISGTNDYGTYGHGHRRSFTTGCMSTCNNKDYVRDGACSGIGCCQTFIPSGTWYINLTLSSYYNHSDVSDFNPCSYAFVVEEEAFLFFADNLTNIDTDTQYVPVLLDWTAEYNVTCADAILNATSYLCKARNSECYDASGAIGYRCRCHDGFEGNPYLAINGCRDIDECESPSLNDCGIYSTCSNTMGGYQCLCDHGTTKEGCIPHNNNPKIAYNLIILPGVASVLGVLCLMVAIKKIKIWRKKKQRERFFKRNGGLLLQGQLSNNEELVQRTKIFSAKELNKASDGFNVNRILGEGGQGTVYKGMLTDGRIVAIKKSKGVDERELVQFVNEVIILSQVIHKNVVKLLGCCLETEVPLLVYEYIPNGTLYSLIHNVNDDQDFPLTWSTRLRIAQEVASALAYLHSSISTPIFHKDIKSLNILMDEKYRAKVSDFGASRSVEVNKTHLTTRVQGTFGYIDPEFFQSNQFTDKSDVYSFGVVLIELLTRQKPISSSRDDLGLVTRFLECMQKGGLRMFLDTEILNESTEEEAIAVANLAGRCVHLNGRRRPTMKEVAMQLENIKKSNHMEKTVHPIHPRSFSYSEEEYGDMSTFTSTGSASFPLLNDTM